MKMRTLALSLFGAAAMVLSLSALLAQPGPGGDGKGPHGGASTRPHDGPPPEGGPSTRPHDPNAPPPGFHLFPREVAEKLKLTADQRKQLDELAKETKEKIDKILTAEQKKILEESRPPHHEGGPGGPGGAGHSGTSGAGGPPSGSPAGHAGT